jgi:hypothetical protein
MAVPFVCSPPFMDDSLIWYSLTMIDQVSYLVSSTLFYWWLVGGSMVGLF